MTKLTGRSAIITGSTSGIGLGIARGLAESGCNILLNGFGDPNEIETLCREIEERHGVRVVYSDADLRVPEALAEMVETARQTFGAVDILVNNAGIQYVAPIQEFPTEKWNDILALNLTAAFHTTRLCLPMMIEKGWGRIINIASAHGLVASPFKAAYVSAKHGLVGLTKVTALETAEAGITCNALCPGYVRTPLVDSQIDDQARVNRVPREEVIRDVILVKHPNRQFVEIEEVAAMALFLCSDGARSMTGTTLSMDGGWTAQ